VERALFARFAGGIIDGLAGESACATQMVQVSGNIHVLVVKPGR